MNYIFFDTPTLRNSLKPFTFTRPLAAIRVGIVTIAEKWEFYTQQKGAFLTDASLQTLFPLQTAEDNLLLNGALCPTDELVAACLALETGKGLAQNGILLAARLSAAQLSDWQKGNFTPETTEYAAAVTLIAHKWDIFTQNGAQIRQDFACLTKGRTSQPITDKHTIVYGAENVFVEEGANIKAAVINAEDGPVYIGRNAQIQEGSLIKGPLALCEGAVINMGGKMRGDNTIGPFCKVGGEVSNSVLFGFSNKGHDGFLGNSVLGEWCNLGADTNNSNLKNNYANVKLYDYSTGNEEDTGLQFCGLMMGDHSKCGINTMFNTGTVVGVGANIFGGGFPAKHIASFAWGGSDSSWEKYRFDKFVETEKRVMARRKKELSAEYEALLKHLYQ